MAAGVGKTYRMLDDAHAMRARSATLPDSRRFHRSAKSSMFFAVHSFLSFVSSFLNSTFSYSSLSYSNAVARCKYFARACA